MWRGSCACFLCAFHHHITIRNSNKGAGGCVVRVKVAFHWDFVLLKHTLALATFISTECWIWCAWANHLVLGPDSSHNWVKWLWRLGQLLRVFCSLLLKDKIQWIQEKWTTSSPLWRPQLVYKTERVEYARTTQKITGLTFLSWSMEMCALASTLCSVHTGCLHKLVLHLFCLLCAHFRLHLTLSSECVSLLVTFPTFWRIVWLGGSSSCELCGLSLHEGLVVLFSFEHVKSQAEHRFCVLFWKLLVSHSLSLLHKPVL